MEAAMMPCLQISCTKAKDHTVCWLSVSLHCLLTVTPVALNYSPWVSARPPGWNACTCPSLLRLQSVSMPDLLAYCRSWKKPCTSFWTASGTQAATASQQQSRQHLPSQEWQVQTLGVFSTCMSETNVQSRASCAACLRAEMCEGMKVASALGFLPFADVLAE